MLTDAHNQTTKQYYVTKYEDKVKAANFWSESVTLAIWQVDRSVYRLCCICMAV